MGYPSVWLWKVLLWRVLLWTWSLEIVFKGVGFFCEMWSPKIRNCSEWMVVLTDNEKQDFDWYTRFAYSRVSLITGTEEKNGLLNVFRKAQLASESMKILEVSSRMSVEHKDFCLSYVPASISHLVECSIAKSTPQKCSVASTSDIWAANWKEQNPLGLPPYFASDNCFPLPFI